MRILLHSTARKAALLGAIILPAALYCFWSARIAWAEHLAQQGTQPALRRATELRPNNAEYHFRLGRLLLSVDQNWEAAAVALRRATELNPHHARYWLELSLVHHIRGDVGQREFALAQALEADPTTPDVAWEAANIYLVSDRTDEALKLFRVVVQNDRVNARKALDLAWRATKDIDALLRYTVPDTEKANSLLLSLICEYKEAAAAQVVWQRLVDLNGPVNREAALKFVDLLLKRGEGANAAKAWDAITSLDPELAAYKPGRNLIVNPSFEQASLNGGLDWRLIRWDKRFTPAIDSSQAHTGAYSLAYTLNSRSLSDVGLLQYVPVAANTRYFFRGYVRSEELLTASGPRFVVRDASNDAQLFASEEVIGTVPWREHAGEFQTGPETTLLKVQVQRVPGNLVIAGRFWIDDLELRKF